MSELDAAPTSSRGVDLLSRLGHGLERDGFAFLTGIPDGFDHLRFLQLFGALLPQYGGATVMTIRAKSDDDSVYHSMSRQELYPHTEAYEYEELPPRYQALWCTKAPDCGGGVTFLSDFGAFWRTLSPGERARLGTRRYTFSSTPGLIAEGIGKPPIVHSVASRADDGHLIFRFSCTCLASSAGEDLRPLIDRYLAYDREQRLSFTWSSNDLLVWDNHRYTHSRSAFTDRSRELVRVWLEPHAQPAAAENRRASV